MKFKMLFIFLFALGLIQAQTRQMESLDRGLVAVQTTEKGVFLSWRLLGTEDVRTAFNIYKNGKRLNREPLDKVTNYTDASGAAADEYVVKKLENGKETEVSKPVKAWETPYRVLQMNRPQMTEEVMGRSGRVEYLPNDCSVGDLDGDGEYEIVVKWNARARDNAQAGITDPVYLDAYKLDGTHLWRINLGKNIRAGAHYTQLMVYDLDGDGIAEVVCKTAPGTIDGTGKPVIMGDDDPNADYRNERGYILDGPEYLTVFNGLTGAEMHTIAYHPPRGNIQTWGDNYGNRVDRFLACIAYLDGVRPSVVMCRGYYTRAVLAAYDFRDGKLVERWVYDSGTERTPRTTAYGQGNHSIAAGDVDGDGRDEIIYGGAAINHDGTLLYTTGLGHGDAGHLSDLDPDRPGLEFFDVHESNPSPAGVEVRDAATGELLFGRPTRKDIGRGLAADIDPNHRGFEFWSTASDTVYNIKGEAISTRRPSINFRIYWDGDLQDELLDGTRIDKWNGDGVDRLVNFADYGAAAINGTKNTPCLSADLFGDWREEVVYYNRQDPSQLLIFTTTIPTEHKLFTLMHDPIYRLSVAWQNVSYNQPPHLGFYIGDGIDQLGLRPAPNAEKKTNYHFDFSGKKRQADVLPVTSNTVYGKQSAFGYDLNTVQEEGKPFFFSVDLPEGNYLVRVVLGSDKHESETTVKAESRRLMLLNVKNKKGKYSTHSFAVNIRNTKINETESVRIKTREIGKLIWDNKLSLEFNGVNPSVAEIEITPVDKLPVIFLAGNSTVVDQSDEPWCGWGQAFTSFLSPEVVVANHAESGLAAGSFVSEKRLAKILTQMKAGDYLFIEFGHNDQKEQGEGKGPYTSYKNNLKYLVDKTREKGGIPVLITPMHRRNFDTNGKIINTHGEYPAAMRQLAKEEHVTLIDLHQMSETLFEAMGVESSKRAFVHYPKGTFPGQNADLADNTHFNFYGGYQIAQCILRGIMDSDLPLKNYILPQYRNFNPARPDPADTFRYPPTPFFEIGFSTPDEAFIPQGNIVTSNIRVHDPVMIKENDTYYIFATGRGVGAMQSKDMREWERMPSLLPSLPWHKADIPEQNGSFWAPDIHYRDGKYHLYYSVSAWMNFNSSIGYATNTTLDPADPAYLWEDQGKIIDFRNGGEGVNCIDPNVFVDTDGKVWLLYGSYRSGLRLVELNPETGKLFSETDPEITVLSTSLGEGVFLLKSTDGYYYIFASRGRCCAGIESTYQVVMGRSRDIKGPYLSKTGDSWTDNRYSLLMAGDYDEPGRGHNGFYTEGETTYIVYHAYNRAADGTSLLRISPLYVDEDGWPSVRNTGKLFQVAL